MIKHIQLSLLALFMAGIFACDKNNNVVVFSIQKDKELGAQVDQEIETSGDYKILSEAQYPAAYSYIKGVRDELLNSGKVAYKDEFVWQVHIIDEPNTLNAFCTPGGYIYFYTGLIKYLEIEDHFVGVLGHEMAHADLRHSSRQMQAQYGIGVLLGVASGGDPGTLSTIAANLAGLSYSRKYEREADAKSVEYLSGSKYSCSGAAGFFQKLESEEASSNRVPPFLSTHPAPDNRIENINEKAAEEGCTTANANTSAYQTFRADLP